MPSTPPSLARRASSGWQMPLTISGRSVSDRSQGRSSHVSGLPKICTHCSTAACGFSSGGSLQARAEDRVAGVVGQALPAQEREVRRRQVARAPARDPGVQRDDDALESGRLGARAPGSRPGRGRSVCTAGKSLGCRRIRRRLAPSGRPTSSTRSSAHRYAPRRARWPGRRARPARTVPMTPTGAMNDRRRQRHAEQLHRQVAFLGADEHPRHQSPARRTRSR